jgi:hypothetical protein
MHPFVLSELAKAHLSDLLREAQRERWVRQATANRPGVIARHLERLGGHLIRIGERLQKRHSARSAGGLGWAEQ